MRIKNKTPIPLIILVAIFIVIYTIGSSVPEVTIRESVKNAGPFGVALLIFLIWTTNVFAPLSATPLIFAGFYLYGPMVTVFSFIAAFFASVSNYWIAKRWGRSIVIKLIGEDSLDKVDRMASNYGLQTLFIARIFLGQFHDILSYLFGLTPIKFYPYIIVSTLGTIPGTILWYFISTKLNNPLTFTIVTYAVAYLFILAYALWLKVTKRAT